MAEFIKSEPRGILIPEIASRVGGCVLADVLEAASDKPLARNGRGWR